MILEYDEVFNIKTPDFPYTSEKETKCTILYFHYLYPCYISLKNKDIFPGKTKS
jgi:hypothetical protein